MSPLGIFNKCTSDYLDMLTALQFDNTTKNYIIRKLKLPSQSERPNTSSADVSKERSSPELLSY